MPFTVMPDKTMNKVQGILSMVVGGSTAYFSMIESFLTSTEIYLRYLGLLLGICLSTIGIYKFFKSELREWKNNKTIR